MSYRVRFHPAVSDDLRGIARSMLPYAGKTITTRVVTELRDAARSLQAAPHRGSLRHEVMPDLRAIPAARRGVIAFTVDDATREVFVLIIAYGGADWMSRVPDRRQDERATSLQRGIIRLRGSADTALSNSESKTAVRRRSRSA